MRDFNYFHVDSNNNYKQMENIVDPDQLASEKPADQDLHCFHSNQDIPWLSMIKVKKMSRYMKVCAAIKGSDQPAPTGSLIRAFASRLNIL